MLSVSRRRGALAEHFGYNEAQWGIRKDTWLAPLRIAARSLLLLVPFLISHHHGLMHAWCVGLLQGLQFIEADSHAKP